MAGSSITSSLGDAVIDMDIGGDLFLLVGSELGGSEHCLFRVCSSTLRRSSLVWKKMLFGSWAEEKPAEGQWTVSLPDDRSTALRIILGIIHGRFEYLPTELPLAQLDELIILVDKYDLTRVIGPWANTWMTRVQHSVEYTALAHVTRTHVAWELGNEDWFATEARNAVFQTSAKKDGQLVYHHDATSFPLANREHFGPPNLIGKITALWSHYYRLHGAPYIVLTSSLEVITQSRLALIQEILDSFHKQISLRTGDSFACDSGCGQVASKKNKSLKSYESNQLHAKKECDIFILGGIYRGMLGLFGGSLPKNASDISESATQLLGVIANLFQQVDCFKDHDSCLPASQFTKFELDARTDQRWKNLLKSSHKESMATRRKALGL